MLLTIHNLPSTIRYSDIRSLIETKCGITDLILDNLLIDGKGHDGKTKKVTIGLADEGDAALVVRKINGLYMDNYQLYVERVKQKQDIAPTEQPYHSNNKPVEPPSQLGFGNSNYGHRAPFQNQYNEPNTRQGNIPPLIQYPNIYGNHGRAIKPLMGDSNYQQMPMASSNDSSFQQMNYQPQMNQGYVGSWNPNVQSDLPSTSGGRRSPLAGRSSDWGNTTYQESGSDNRRGGYKSTTYQESGSDNRREGYKSTSYQESGSDNRRGGYKREYPRSDVEYNRRSSNLQDTRDADWDTSRSGNRDSHSRHNWQEQDKEPQWGRGSSSKERRSDNSFKGSTDPWANKKIDRRPGVENWRDKNNQNNAKKTWVQPPAPKKKGHQNTASRSQTSKNAEPSQPPPIEPWVDNSWINDNYPSRRGHEDSFEVDETYKPPARKLKKYDVTTKFTSDGRIKKSVWRRDQVWRCQATSIIAKNILNEFQDSLDSNVRQRVMKHLKNAVRIRVNLVLQNKFHVLTSEIEEMYKQKFPDHGNKKFFMSVLAKMNENVQHRIPTINLTDTVVKKETAPQVKSETTTEAEKTQTGAGNSQVKVTPVIKKTINAPKGVKTGTLPKAKKPLEPGNIKGIFKEQKRNHKMEFECDDMYSLDPVQAKALKKELDAVIDMYSTACDEVSAENKANDKRGLHMKRVTTEALVHFNKVVKLALTKRLLNIPTNLVVSIFGYKLKREPLGQFLRKYGVTTFRQTDRKKFFVANCETFETYDTLCSLKDIVIGDINVTIKPLHATGPKEPYKKPGRNNKNNKQNNYVPTQVKEDETFEINDEDFENFDNDIDMNEGVYKVEDDDAVYKVEDDYAVYKVEDDDAVYKVEDDDTVYKVEDDDTVNKVEEDNTVDKVKVDKSDNKVEVKYEPLLKEEMTNVSNDEKTDDPLPENDSIDVDDAPEDFDDANIDFNDDELEDY